MSLAGKKALVTGATAGIGRAIAEAFAAAGATLVLSGRDEARAHALLTELRAQGHEAHFIAGDQADPATAVLAGANLGREVIVGDAVELLDALVSTGSTDGRRARPSD